MPNWSSKSKVKTINKRNWSSIPPIWSDTSTLTETWSWSKKLMKMELFCLITSFKSFTTPTETNLLLTLSLSMLKSMPNFLILPPDKPSIIKLIISNWLKSSNTTNNKDGFRSSIRTILAWQCIKSTLLRSSMFWLVSDGSLSTAKLSPEETLTFFTTRQAIKSWSISRYVETLTMSKPFTKE